ncbi:MAG: hypothetical protein ACR2PX_02290 [Endozoicomonas sp.]|uniref:hypothetical protein n=1 Tax=Endozoicomonas sp. TaxID=1892382 RepID=UPI003D9BA309
MEVNTSLRNSLLFPLIYCVSILGHCAQQGSLGYTSSGSFKITLTIHPKLSAQVASSRQLISGKEITQAEFNKKEPLCIQGTGISLYSITATNLSKKEGFLLETPQETIPYEVEIWTDASSRQQLNNGIPSQSLPVLSPNTACSMSGPSIAVKLQNPVTSQTRQGALELTISAE